MNPMSRQPNDDNHVLIKERKQLESRSESFFDFYRWSLAEIFNSCIRYDICGSFRLTMRRIQKRIFGEKIARRQN